MDVKEHVKLTELPDSYPCSRLSRSVPTTGGLYGRWKSFRTARGILREEWRLLSQLARVLSSELWIIGPPVNTNLSDNEIISQFDRVRVVRQKLARCNSLLFYLPHLRQKFKPRLFKFDQAEPILCNRIQTRHIFAPPVPDVLKGIGTINPFTLFSHFLFALCIASPRCI